MIRPRERGDGVDGLNLYCPEFKSSFTFFERALGGHGFSRFASWIVEKGTALALRPTMLSALRRFTGCGKTGLRRTDRLFFGALRIG
jgi:hypothetical protein